MDEQPTSLEQTDAPAGEGEKVLHPARRSRFVPLSMQQKETLAHQAVMGMSYSEMARLHDLDPLQVHNAFKSEWMKQRVSEVRAHLMEASSRIMFRYLMHADRLADDQVQCALTPGPDQYKARTYILDRVAPPRHISQQQTEVNVNINQEVMIGLRDTLREVNLALGARPGQVGIALLDGKTALPAVDIGMDEGDTPQ